MKIEGFYSFKTMLSKLSNLILIADDEDWIRRDVFNEYNPSYSLNFALKQWYMTGNTINYSKTPSQHNYKDVIITDNNYSEPAVLIGLSNKKAIAIQTWTGTGEIKMSGVLLNINGTQISSNGYSLFENPQYPVAGGRINDEKAFLLDYLHGRILSIVDDELQITNKTLNRALISIFGSNEAIYLSKNAILLFQTNYGFGVNIQLITIDEDDSFDVKEHQEFELPFHFNSTYIKIAKLSSNKAFIAYVKKLPDSGWNFTIEGRVLSVNNSGVISLGEPTTLLDYSTVQDPPLTDTYTITDPFYLSTIPGTSTVIAWYLFYKTKYNYFANPDLPSTTTIQTQLINISESSTITTQPIINVEDAVQNTEYSYFFSFFNLGFIPTSNNSFIALIDHGGLYGSDNLPRYISFAIENGNIVKKRTEIITNSYDLSGSFTKDYDFLTLAMRNYEANGQFGRYTIIPPFL